METTKNVEVSTLVEIYKATDKKTKTKMEQKFGKELFVPKPDETIITWEQVAKQMKMYPVNSLPFPKPKNDRHKRMNEQWIMDVMVEFFNTDPVSKKVWEPSPADWGHRVWYEYKTGVGFVFDCSAYGFGDSTLGSRLHLKDAKAAERAAKSLQAHQNRLFKNPK